MALNLSHLAAIAASIRVLLLLALLVVVAPTYGVVGVADSIAALSCAMVIADYAISSRLLKINIKRFLAVVWRPVLASLAMCVAVWFLRAGFLPATDLSERARLLAQSVLLGVVVYVVCVLVLWTLAGRRDGAERRLVALMSRYLGHRGRIA
jgi:O-antigen/teichoic acid export membrane protein